MFWLSLVVAGIFFYLETVNFVNILHLLPKICLNCAWTVFKGGYTIQSTFVLFVFCSKTTTVAAEKQKKEFRFSIFQKVDFLLLLQFFQTTKTWIPTHTLTRRDTKCICVTNKGSTKEKRKSKNENLCVTLWCGNSFFVCFLITFWLFAVTNTLFFGLSVPDRIAHFKIYTLIPCIYNTEWIMHIFFHFWREDKNNVRIYATKIPPKNLEKKQRKYYQKKKQQKSQKKNPIYLNEKYFFFLLFCCLFFCQHQLGIS